MKPFIVKYSWEKINCPSQNDDYKKIEKNNLTISLSVFYTKKEKIPPAFTSKHHSKLENKLF